MPLYPLWRSTRVLRSTLAMLTVCSGLAFAAEPAPSASAPETEGIAIFAGGCFWCMEPPFDVLPGVISTTSGYIGGRKRNPTYEQVSSGRTGHAEAVEIRYDPNLVGYEKLLEVFWRNIDPFAVDAQFCDHGSQYRSAIFYKDEEQQRLAEASKHALSTSGKLKQDIATKIEPATEFYPAEAYHQNYYKENPVRYKIYRLNCGRDRRLEAVWGPAETAH